MSDMGNINMHDNTTTTHPLLYSKVEAGRLLRLDTNKASDAHIAKAVDRLVDKKILRPTLIGGRRMFTHSALHECILKLTAA